MATGQMSRIIEHFRQTVPGRGEAVSTDAQLLRGYIARHDDAAFAAMVRRHGPMVLSVCRRVLRNSHDADDAFQATFLVLARKASTIRSRELLANWLYGVAYQTALKARAAAVKRRTRESQLAALPEPEAARGGDRDDWKPLLDQELNALPAKYRSPIVLCDLEGKTRKDAAEQLDLPEGTLSSRLSRARTMLAKRLTRHGIALSGGVIATALSQNAASACLPASLVGFTIQGAASMAAGKAVPIASAEVVALTEGVLKAMFLTRLKIATLVLLFAGLLGIGGSMFTTNGVARPSEKPTVSKESRPVAQAKEGPESVSWLLFHGNPRQTGVAVGKLPAKLDTIWTFKAEDAFESAVAVAEGVVFAGSMDENVYAVDLKTGKQKWKFKAGPFKAAPSVKGGKVYIGDLDGNLYCLDASKGTKRWEFSTGAEVGGVNFNGTDVLVASHDENLYCLDKDGKQRWKFKTDGPIYGSVAIADGKTFLVGCDSQMHVIDAAKGKQESSVDLEGQSGATAAIEGDRLYVGTMRNEVRSIDWKKSQIEWTYKSKRNGQAFFSSPAVTEKFVIIGGRDKLVHCIDRKTGLAEWTFPTGDRVDSSPVVVGNRVVVGSMDSNVYVLDLATGKQIQKIPVDGAVTGSPAVVGGLVLIGTQKGTLYCLGEKK